MASSLDTLWRTPQVGRGPRRIRGRTEQTMYVTESRSRSLEADIYTRHLVIVREGNRLHHYSISVDVVAFGYVSTIRPCNINTA